MIDVRPAFHPPLERNFAPAALWNRAYRALVARNLVLEFLEERTEEVA